MAGPLVHIKKWDPNGAHGAPGPAGDGWAGPKRSGVFFGYFCYDNTKGPATADKSEGALFLIIYKKKKIRFFYKISKIDKNLLFKYIQGIFDLKNDSPSNSAYSDIFKSICLSFFQNPTSKLTIS